VSQKKLHLIEFATSPKLCCCTAMWNAISASCTQNRWLSAPRNLKHQTLLRRTLWETSQMWIQSITRSGLSCNVMSIRQKSIAWVNETADDWYLMWPWPVDLGLDMAVDSNITWHIRLMNMTRVEDFGRAKKQDNSNTACELTILILSISVTLSLTFVWLLHVTSFIQKVPATSTFTLVVVLQGAAAELGWDDRF